MTAIEDAIRADPEYQLFCRGRLANPYPLYQRLRTEDPVHWAVSVNSWVLTRYADVVFALQYDPRLTAERLTPLIKQLPDSVQREMEPLRQHLRTWMQYYDPPDHTRLRSLVSKAFTPPMLENMRQRIQDIVNDLLNPVVARGQMDAIKDFAYPLPAIVVGELLGVPAADRDQYKHWADDIAAFLEGISPTFPAVARQAQRSMLAQTAYLRDLFAKRRQHPQEDLISALVAVEEQGDVLSEAELFGMCVFVLNAGHETTTGLIGNGLLALLQHPDQMQMLKNDPALVGTAVEEFLRYDGSIQRISRVAVQDFELGGKPIKRGQRIWAMQGAANRDPAQFSDPDRLDITRQKNKHVGFGYGVHHCLGAPLARLETQIAFNTMLRRLPGLRLTAESLEWWEGVSLRTLVALPVAFGNEPKR